jgi:formate dehydrogenase subunit gamma
MRAKSALSNDKRSLRQAIRQRDYRGIRKPARDARTNPACLLDRFGWISDEAIRQLASELNLSRADVHGVVSYYHDFRTSPPGKHVVKICEAEACQSMGSRELSKHAQKSLGVAMHESNDDVTLEPVYCLGNCACSPAIMVDGKTFGRVNADRFDEIVATMNEAR